MFKLRQNDLRPTSSWHDSKFCCKNNSALCRMPALDISTSCLSNSLRALQARCLCGGNSSFETKQEAPGSAMPKARKESMQRGGDEVLVGADFYGASPARPALKALGSNTALNNTSAMLNSPPAQGMSAVLGLSCCDVVFGQPAIHSKCRSNTEGEAASKGQGSCTVVR